MCNSIYASSLLPLSVPSWHTLGLREHSAPRPSSCSWRHGWGLISRNQCFMLLQSAVGFVCTSCQSQTLGFAAHMPLLLSHQNSLDLRLTARGQLCLHNFHLSGDHYVSGIGLDTLPRLFHLILMASPSLQMKTQIYRLSNFPSVTQPVSHRSGI